MKRFLKVFTFACSLFFVLPQTLTCQESQDDLEQEADEYFDDEYFNSQNASLTQNGKDDQYITMRIMPLIPLNFDGQLLVGGGISVGYHRFLNQYISVGADVMFGYNTTIGSNLFTLIPITACITYQPYIKKFEFPMSVSVGFAIENYLQYNYFPGLVLKGSAGCFYRMNENWSCGAEGVYFYLPQWFVKDSSKNDYYSALAISLSARYHF